MKLWEGASLAIILCCACLSILLLTRPSAPSSATPTMPARPRRSWVAPPLPPPALSKTPSSSSSSSSIALSSSSSSSQTSPSSSTSLSSSSSSSSSSSTSSPPHLTALSSSPPAARPARLGGLRRRGRSVDGMGSILSEFSYLFQSFTEGELKQIVGALVDRKSQRRESAEDSAEDDEVQGGTAGWSTEDRQGRRTKRAHKGKKGCSLQEVRRTVTELGLGYESDETVVFRYCSGRCTTQRRNYDIILEHLQKGRQLDESSVSLERKARARRDKARYSPCCRPTRYENSMSFLDNKNQFYTIPYVSARECGCV